MLRLKGKVVYGELEGDWLKFDVNQIDGVAGDGIGLRVRSSDRNIFIIDPSTIQPAKDPRKQMLEEIRAELRGLILVQAKGLPLGYPCDWVDAILNEMEAKL